MTTTQVRPYGRCGICNKVIIVDYGWGSILQIFCPDCQITDELVCDIIFWARKNFQSKDTFTSKEVYQFALSGKVQFLTRLGSVEERTYGLILANREMAKFYLSPDKIKKVLLKGTTKGK